MRFHKNSLITIAAVLIMPLLFSCVPAAAQTANPLVTPYEIADYTETSDRMLNILLLGIDLGMDGYWGSGYKSPIEACHTDANMVIAVNLDQTRIDLISLPRDTVSYVPGVRGIYKLNGAMNCGNTLAEGLSNTKHAAERLLGNIRIDYYFAVDMQTMILLGDAIGGADIDSEMRYQGSSGRWYEKGMQHMDGMGIMDYVRARTNATVNYTDIGRTNRQRVAMLAVFTKLRNNSGATADLFQAALTQYDHFTTDIDAAGIEQLSSLLPIIFAVDPDTVGLHVLTGSYRGMLEWNFTYTDQANRLAVLADVYGIAAEPIPYVSTKYAQWLRDTGFTTVHYISLAQEIMEETDENTLTDMQNEAYTAFLDAYQRAVFAFCTAADTLDNSDTLAMQRDRKALRDAGDAYAQAIGYSNDLPWYVNSEVWYEDPYINDFQFDWR